MLLDVGFNGPLHVIHVDRFCGIGELYKSNGNFAASLVQASDNSNILDIRVLQERSFKFSRADLEALLRKDIISREVSIATWYNIPCT